MSPVKLISCGQGLGLYRNESGNMKIAYRTWESRKNYKWNAKWTDVLGGVHEINAPSLVDLNKQLQPYGIKLVR